MDIRNLLFGDLPSDSWPDSRVSLQPPAEPWTSFVSAREFLRAGDVANAKQSLQQILAMADLESRHYLQAWHFLRALGEQPTTSEARHLYGVVVEVALEEGVDLVAAYADHSARYYNYSGAAIIWDRPNASLDEVIDKMLSAGQVVIEQIGPWEAERPPAPTPGLARINLLAPAGLHFGEASYEALSGDPMGGPVLKAAFALMQGLINSTEVEH